MKSDPKGTVFSLAVLALLFRFTTIDRWWVWFITIAMVLGLFGYHLSMLGFIIAVAVWKVLKDMFYSR
jgi:hypothetical protein